MPNLKKQAAGRKGALERQRRRSNRQAAGRKGGLARKRKQ